MEYKTNMQKIYLIKNLAPWMIDELLAFSDITKFKVVLLKKQNPFFNNELEKLKRRGIEIYSQPKNYKNFIEKLFFIVPFFINNIKKFRFDYNGVIGIKSILWFLRLDINIFQPNSNIHAQFATQAAILSLMIKKFRKNKLSYSFTFHAHDIFFTNRWFSLLVRESKVAFSISNFNILYIDKYYANFDKTKIKLSRLGVFKPAIISKKKIGHDKITIGFLSWFVEKKGIIYLLQAIKILQSKFPNKFHFLIAGDGPLKHNIIDFIRTEDLSNVVKYIGQVDNKTKTSFFNSLDIFTLPSIELKNNKDGIPVVLMEAISYGIPVISTNVSGIPEICLNDHNGILINEKSSKDLVAAIIRISSNFDRYINFSHNAVKLYSKSYSIEKNSSYKLKKILWLEG